jgi:hypothetical protein
MRYSTDSHKGEGTMVMYRLTNAGRALLDAVMTVPVSS